MNVLSLDTATKTGWATFYNNKRVIFGLINNVKQFHLYTRVNRISTYWLEICAKFNQ